MSTYIPLHDRPPYFASLPDPTPSHLPPSPRYAPPDLDPDEPYPWTRQGAAMSGEQEGYDQDEEVDRVDYDRAEAMAVREQEIPNGQIYQEGQAGPSRKRPRTEDGARSNGARQHTHQPRRSEIIPSIFGISPRDEFTKTVGEFVMAHCRGQDHVEASPETGGIAGQSTR